MKPSARPERRYDVLKVSDKSRDRVADRLASEEPMEIRVRWLESGTHEKSIAVTMRTPGHDFDLAAGFLFTERIIAGRDDVVDIAYCLDVDAPQERNVVTVTLAPPVSLDLERLERNFFANSSCGICGKATLESLELAGCVAVDDGPTIPSAVLRSLPERMRAGQGVFEATGGLHAAALFEPDGTLVSLREDIGRHNAVDKLIGGRLMAGMPLDDSVLLVSGRAGFEILQKALVARVPIVAAVGAPSSLAVDVAQRFGTTLVGFLRGERLNVYSRPERVGP